MLQIAVFLYYWERIQAELAAEKRSAALELTADLEDFTDGLPHLGEFKDDGNPYHPPQS